MTSLKQIAANRRNASKSTGPKTEDGKYRSRLNAVRHGLTAETVIGALEDDDDYKAFEAAVTLDYDAQSAVERELVLRLASLLWRLRRATAVEAGLFEIQAAHSSNLTELTPLLLSRGKPRMRCLANHQFNPIMKHWLRLPTAKWKWHISATQVWTAPRPVRLLPSPILFCGSPSYRIARSIVSAAMRPHFGAKWCRYLSHSTP
jgi:hypothetical protein